MPPALGPTSFLNSTTPNFSTLPHAINLDATALATLHNRHRPIWTHAIVLCVMSFVFAARLPANAAASAQLPEIRMHRDNGVPACVTPDRLMAFLQMRNARLAPRYRDIAKWYRHHGEAWRVRWDYAFFQMALETNFLSYRRANGDPGDVRPEQNNFAGIGATGGGVPGDRFPDVSTGVLAQIQHLVAYSGEPVDRPVAARTKLKQNDIVSVMRRLKRAPRFSDLARRWAADARYANSIAFIAESFERTFCEEPSQMQRPARGAQLKSTPPEPMPSAKARAQRVARTVWRRGETLGEARVGNRTETGDGAVAQPLAKVPPLPQPAQRSTTSVEIVADNTVLNNSVPEGGFLSGLQGMARSMDQNINQWPQALEKAPAIIAPTPRPADRVPRIASRQ